MKIALLMLFAATAASTPQQFDLICKGSGDVTHYRVDLAAKKWCWENCASTWPIARVEDERITFKEDDTPSEKVWNWVSRTTGEWFQGMRSATLGEVSSHGTCEPAPFSGFPAHERKF
jgi:hypothetical protein